jgi:hypothetical protein
MQKKILSVFFTILFFGVVGVLYSFFDYTDDEIVETKEYPSPIDKKEKIQNLGKSWISSLVKNRNSSYFYPVNELYMHIDLHKYIAPKVKTYKLIIQNVDRYSLFCVMQTLQAFNLPFVFTKQKKAPTIYMGSDTKKRLKGIKSALARYGIDSKIIEEWK